MDRRIKNFLILFFVICILFVLSAALFACNGSTFRATFVVDGETYFTSELKEGQDISAPSPQKDGYDFDGWYENSDFEGEKAEFPTTMPKGDVTYYGRFIEQTKSVGYVVQYYLQKLNAQKSAAIDDYEMSEESFDGNVGESVTAPTATFEGFVRTEHENELPTITLDEDESKNVLRVYYDRGTHYITFDANGGEGEMEELSFVHGALVRNDFDSENEFTRDGYRFAGFAGRFDTGGAVPPGVDFEINADVKFVAQWHRAYASRDGLGDIVYSDGASYYRMIDGARDVAQNRASSTQMGRAYDEFSFADGDDEIICRLYDGDDTYEISGPEMGMYVQFDYVTADYAAYVLTVNGFGYATYSEILSGGAAHAVFAGTYAYDEQGGDYVFDIYDPETQNSLGREYFELFSQKPEEIQNDEISGSFILHGHESGEYFEYDVITGEVYEDRVLQLFGNGYARIMGYEQDSQDYTAKLSEGDYVGTQNYEDYFGEWQYTPAQGEQIRFTLNFIAGEEDGGIPIFMEYNPELDVTLYEEDGKGGVLTLGGYNAALYSVGGTTSRLSGAIAFAGDSMSTLRFTPYDDAGNPQDPLLFDVNFAEGTFKLNEDGFVIENGILIGYEGTSPVVEIPEEATSIAEEAMTARKLGVKLTHVTIPASVQSIGARAFQNENTLMSVTFLSETPIDIDWSAANDPFRWPMAGAFRIFVPNDSLEAYKEKWADCEYKITSVVAEKDKPVYEIEDGVLVSYNNDAEYPENIEIRLPDEALSVAANVFKDIPYIVSVDLNNVVGVGESAFEGCVGLESVTAPKLEDIGAAAFALCTSLESVTLPAVKTIGEQAFASDEALCRVELGADIERIGDRAFFGCAEHPLVLDFVLAEGTNVPIMGTLVFGIASYLVSVETVDDALALYGASGRGWNRYAGRASVRECENSEIAGEWVDVATLNPAEIGGRMELVVDGDIFVYRLEGGALKLYAYDADIADYFEISGTYADGKLSFEYNGARRLLVRAEGELNYDGANGETLVVHLDEYEAGEIINDDGTTSGFAVRAAATFNGARGELNVTGSSITISGVAFEDVTIGGAYFGAVKGNVALRLSADGTFGCTKQFDDVRGPYAAADGSEINLEIYGSGSYLASSVCLTGHLAQFKNAAGSDIQVETRGTWQVFDRPEDGTYVAVYNYLSDRYYITVTLDDENMTFAYSFEKAASYVTLSGSGVTKVVALMDKDGTTIISLSIILQNNDGGTDSLYVRKFEKQADGTYLAEAEQRVMQYDAASESYVESLGELSGVYTLTLDFEQKTCTVVRTGSLA